jgi:hypothetical protein
MEKDAHSQYLKDVKNRVINLSEEEKSMLMQFRQTPEGTLVARIVGPDVAGIGGVQVDQFAQADNVKNKMPMPQGLGARPQR